MNFFGKLISGGKNKSDNLSPNKLLKSITFDLKDCELLVDKEYELGWLNKDYVGHALKLNPPVTWDFDLRQPQKAEDHYEQECAGFNGKMLSADVIEIDGKEALMGIFKYRSADNPRARMYVGIIWIPFTECTVMLNVEALERGITGLRESIVALEEPQPEPEFAPDPITVSSVDEMFAHMAKQPLIILPSDDPKWDAKFPEHPLSLVRARLKRVIETFQLPEYFRTLEPWRIG